MLTICHRHRSTYSHRSVQSGEEGTEDSRLGLDGHKPRLRKAEEVTIARVETMENTHSTFGVHSKAWVSISRRHGMAAYQIFDLLVRSHRNHGC